MACSPNSGAVCEYVGASFLWLENILLICVYDNVKPKMKNKIQPGVGVIETSPSAEPGHIEVSDLEYQLLY